MSSTLIPAEKIRFPDFSCALHQIVYIIHKKITNSKTYRYYIFEEEGSGFMANHVPF